ncbi:MAG: alpha/beta hydrolase [Gammaproteobacteria bacterium]|nr:alpha/beta hydrolase [Gammaproteobacteria bacterium]HCI19383.1 alpha/beta hydrolase [Alphaproteobacteria bacterium]|tara:strand:- start:2059 stop:2952 length:894 start_codon:yes stop_codon:yes gene_type:complete
MTDHSPLAAADELLAYIPPADLDDAYENSAYIPGAASWLQGLPDRAASFRASQPDAMLNQPYGKSERQRYDLFTPEGGLDVARGLLAIVHGGYWMALSKDDFSYLATGPLARGWAVAMIGYTLAPQARIAEITTEIAAATNAVAKLGNGPLRLVGHSAGGHLVARMMCRDVALSDQAAQRLDRVVSVSGLHDLRPLRRLAKNETWQLDDAEAATESPVMQIPREGIELACIAGADERPEFIRQNALLPIAWQGLGTPAYSRLLAGDHHFSVIDHLANMDSDVCKSVVSSSLEDNILL